MKLNSLGFFDIGSFFGKIFKSPPQQNATGKSGKPSVGPPPPAPSLSDSSPGLSSALSAKGIFGRAPARQSSAKQLAAPGGSQAAAGSPIAARLGTMDQLHGAGSSSSPSSSPSQISTAGIIASGGGSPSMVWPASGANTVSTLSPAAASQHQQQRLSPRFARPASVGARAEAHGGSDRFLVTVGIGRAPPLPVPPYGLPDIHEEDFLPRMYEQQHHQQQQQQQHQQQRHIHDSRGLARGGVDQPPLPEPAGNALPLAFSQHMQHAISAYNRSSLESSESSGNTTPTELDKSWSAIHSDTTCPSTEQSSLFSWGDDEFERVASRRVQQLFREIDALLYEGMGSAQTPALQGECMQWKTRFLHLRILGKQLVEPTDEGYQLVPTEGTAADRTEPPGFVSTGHNPSDRELCLQGSRLVPRGTLAGPSRGGAVSPAAQSHRDNGSGSGGEEGEEGEEVAQEAEEEEVICRDGTVEEVLAFDSHEPEEDGPEWRHAGGNRCGAWRARRGLPPVSPAACLRDAVCTELFDQLWAEALGCLHALDQQSWDAEEKGLTGVERPAMQRILLPRQAGTADSLSMPPSRGSDTRSYLPQLHRTSLSGRPGDLHGVMMIQAKPLQQRHGTVMDKLPLPSALEERVWSGRPASSVLSLPRSRAGPRPGAAAAADDALPAFSRVALSSARRRPHPAAGPRPDARAKTSSVNRQEVLRGTRLAMGASERLSTPQMSAVRNTLLPPIGSPDPHESQLTVPGARASQTKGRLSISRVSSAVTDDTSRRPVRDRPSLVLEHPSRPNTTHTFRSDMQLRRSLTPMEYNNATRTGRASLGSDSLKIRVTGIGLSSAGYQLDPFSLHALGHSPLEDDEDHPPAYHPSWGAESHLHHKPQSRSSNGKKRFPMAL
ncbi:protein FAM149B1-like isoform X2 [Petromyzon marinus]|uniref:Protein FAM149B1-like isoform X2 n=1 Tax=Petromyzon marinus TaxID=7757 RepID=A0AAJ7X8N4_PETMA|nr:protein FAM149B1-like isoform X2 [Petromyzon marinus]